MSKKQLKVLSDNLFPVVGIGASAGGLDAFKRIIVTIPENSGMAFILVQHLDPLHESVLSELLQRVTKIPVIEIMDNLKVAPNHIYIIPSNKILIANDGVLRLYPRTKSKNYLPINIFFSSLADIHQNYAIGVVLSGTGVDGTVGLRTIKDKGGISIVQEIKTAAYPGMPKSAIEAGAATHVLPLENIIGKVQELTASLPRKPRKNESGKESLKEKDETALKQIISLIRHYKGVDFTYYKQPTIQRRILRRVTFSETRTYSEYYKYLQEHKEEQNLLYQDLLIPVTSFFRDPTSFDDLKEKVLSVIIQGKSKIDPLRIWVAGCSTGEEAYSFGICLSEYLEDKLDDFKIQIFASDVSEVAIVKARSGIYTKEEVSGLSKDRLNRYFTKVDGDYHVNKSIRELCLFANHNFLKDPPFARVDLISCRNVLIYFQPYLQKKAFDTFHFALNEKRFLILGKSENISTNTDLFNISSKKKIFIKKENVEKSRSPGSAESVKGFRLRRENSASKGPRKEAYQKDVDDIILFKYSAVGVILNDQLDIVQFRGATSAFLESPAGKATLNVLKMARGNLAYELRSAITEVRTSNEPVIKEGIAMEPSGRMLSLEVIPLLTTIEPYFLVLFHNEIQAVVTTLKIADDNESLPAIRNDARDIRIVSLEKELIRVKAEMRNMNEEQEAANEELQSANEELLSGSEELQSLNEELEITKEEIQSTNEELSIVNHELIDRNEQLTQSRQFAEAVVTTLHEPLLILNSDLRIVRANKSFYEIFNLNEAQTVGKILFELQDAQWDIPGLRKKLFEIQTHKSSYTAWEVACKFEKLGELHLGFNAQPIQNGKDVQLILLAIDNITLRRNEEERRKAFSDELEKQIEERTLSLKKVNIELERSNDNLNQFVFIASHDLQEPLRKLQIFVSKLTGLQNRLPEGAKGIVEKVGRSARLMSELLRDVLAFSTVSSIKSSYVKTDLNLILKKVLLDLGLLVSEKKVSIDMEVLPIIKAEPVLINQLFNNLISNSIKFSDKEKIKITITSRTLLPGEVHKYSELNEHLSYCEIMVRDNGVGFESEYAERIFEIFQRLSKSYHGTGIGLALCRKIVNLHEGRIYANGKPGEGATFFILLPLYNKSSGKPSLKKSSAVVVRKR